MGKTILLIEQNASMALSIADRGYVLETGKIIMEGKGKELLVDPRVKAAYLARKKTYAGQRRYFKESEGSQIWT